MVLGNVRHSQQVTIAIIFTGNPGLLCGRNMFGTWTQIYLKVRNSPHMTEHLMKGGRVPVFIINDLIWESFKLIIPLTKFITDGLRKWDFKRRFFVGIMSFNLHF